MNVSSTYLLMLGDKGGTARVVRQSGTATVARGVQYLDQSFRLNVKEFHADPSFFASTH